MSKPSTYFTQQGIRDWIKACGFRNDMEASTALKVPFRTFGRWKSKGLPAKNTANLTYSRVIISKMMQIAGEKSKKA